MGNKKCITLELFRSGRASRLKPLVATEELLLHSCMVGVLLSNIWINNGYWCFYNLFFSSPPLVLYFSDVKVEILIERWNSLVSSSNSFLRNGWLEQLLTPCECENQKKVYFCPVNQILKNERVRYRVEKDGVRKPVHNEIWAKTAQKNRWHVWLMILKIILKNNFWYF